MLVHVNCPTHGELLIEADKFFLIVFTITGEGTYRFPCEQCGSTYVKFAALAAVQALRSAAAPEAILDLPAELLEEHFGIPILWDDVFDFTQALEGAESPLLELEA